MRQAALTAELVTISQNPDRVEAEFAEFVPASTAKAGVVVDGVVCGPGTCPGRTEAEPSFRTSASYLVGCDGANSAVRRLEGMTQTDLGFKEDWLIIDLVNLALLTSADASSFAMATCHR